MKTKKRVPCGGSGATPLRPTYGNPKASCPVCGGWISLKKNGTMRKHMYSIEILAE